MSGVWEEKRGWSCGGVQNSFYTCVKLPKSKLILKDLSLLTLMTKLEEHVASLSLKHAVWLWEDEPGSSKEFCGHHSPAFLFLPLLPPLTLRSSDPDPRAQLFLPPEAKDCVCTRPSDLIYFLSYKGYQWDVTQQQ